MNTMATDYSKVVKQCQQYEYVRFTFADINGTARGKVVPVRSVKKFLENGLQIYSGTFCFGTGTGQELPMKTMEADIISKGNPSCNLIADPETFHSVTWYDRNEGEPKWKIAEIYCEPHWLDTNLPQPAPRYIARNLLKKLDDMGLEVLSGTEYEFKIYKDNNPTARVPVFPSCEYASVLRFSLLQDLILHLDSNLERAGVNLDNLMCEESPGQFELVLEPTKGIKAADDAFLFRQGVAEMVLRQGFGVSFMAKPDSIRGGGCGAHFNFSLWDKSTGKNVFYDREASDNLGTTAKHWIAGVIKHAPAITALCSPTVNCYRRVHQPWAPDIADWNYLDRNAFLRVKNDGEDGTYMENRIPSSTGNPYIVMAATLAAGIDGVIHKISPPSPHDTSAAKLPSTLSEALDALEADKDLAQILGADLVKYFISVKREVDVVKFKDHDVSIFNEEQLNAEILGYDMILNI